MILLERQCWSGECIPSSQWCDAIPNCVDGSDEHKCGPFECSGYLCLDGKCIAKFKVGDFILDCADGEDEKDVLISILTMSMVTTGRNCSQGGLPCYPGHSRCIPFSKACL